MNTYKKTSDNTSAAVVVLVCMGLMGAIYVISLMVGG